MKRLLLLATMLAAGAIFAVSAGAQEQDGDVAESDAGLRLPNGPVETDSRPTSQVVDPRLAGAEGETRVVVQLSQASLAENVRANSARSGGLPSESQQRGYVQELRRDQDAFVSRARGIGAQEVTRIQKALNAVVLDVDAEQIRALGQIEGVESVRPVVDYELDLSETVPYIGGTAVQRQGFDGTGVNVAVLDSGVDYTHEALGGAGTDAAYEAAYGTGPDDPQRPFDRREGLFPTDKVYEGYDFVGEDWTGAADTPPTKEDDDPIDYEGHGTHVSDIIAGQKGVAPGAQILGVKVCSAVGSACEGVALLKGVDYALDPNGDGDISDAVDIINMSLGSSYGQKEDDLSEASANASRLGVLVVASAGNSADRPYIAGSPSTTPEVMSVAQTQVPSAEAIPLVVNSPEDIAGEYPNTATLEYAPIPEEGVTDDVAYVGQGCPAGSVPGQPEADPYLDDPSGKIALIDRGGCDVSTKIDRAADAGATGALIANNAPGDPPGFSQGGGDDFVPTLVITQGDGQLIKDALEDGPVNVTISPENAVPLEGSVVASSSRGPSYSYDAIKPDIGAPGASVSAIAGSGDGTEAFGGTSGAAPMVAGAAALLADAYPARSPAELKSVMMNTAETDIETNPATDPGALAPITRIGGGEVRVDRALDSTTVAYDAEQNTGSLSFGYRAVNGTPVTLTKRVTVKNYGNSSRTYQIDPQFRYRDDARSGAVTIDAPDSITVSRQGQRVFDVTINIDGKKLPRWTLDGGQNGGDGSLLQSVEFDGYINISDSTDDVHVAFHVLPHKAADVDAQRDAVRLQGGRASVELTNENGAIKGPVEAFAWTGTSPQVPEEELPQPGDTFSVTDLRWTGVRQAEVDGEQAIQFAVNTFENRSHPNYPAEFDIGIDPDRDGTYDYVIFNSELGGFGVTGQNVVNVLDVEAGTATAYFFTDADLNSANAILTAPMEAVGLKPGTKFNFFVEAYDNYFTGQRTDRIGRMTFTPNRPKFNYFGLAESGIPIGGSDTLTIRRKEGGPSASPSQQGILFLYPDARIPREAEVVRVSSGS